jgi:hypothetical protein
MTKKLMCALALMAAATPALADHGRHDDGINERQHRLEQRIEDGRRSGQLTRHEYARLRHELGLIARDEHAFRGDGRLSGGERQHLHARLDALTRAVSFEKRDGERRGSYYYSGPRADRRF